LRLHRSRCGRRQCDTPWPAASLPPTTSDIFMHSTPCTASTVISHLCSLYQHLCFLADNPHLIPHPRSVENWHSHYPTLRSSSEALRTHSHQDVIHRQVAVCVVAVEVVVNLDRSAGAVSPTWLLPSQHQSSFPGLYWIRSTHVTISHIQKERQAAWSHQPFPSSAVSIRKVR
jgi:hypothetical protein